MYVMHAPPPAVWFIHYAVTENVQIAAQQRNHNVTCHTQFTGQIKGIERQQKILSMFQTYGHHYRYGFVSEFRECITAFCGSGPVGGAVAIIEWARLYWCHRRSLSRARLYYLTDFYPIFFALLYRVGFKSFWFDFQYFPLKWMIVYLCS